MDVTKLLKKYTGDFVKKIAEITELEDYTLDINISPELGEFKTTGYIDSDTVRS